MKLEIILIIILLIILVFLVLFANKKVNRYELLGASDPNIVSQIINKPASDNPIEDHFIKGQAYEHVYNDYENAANEYKIVTELVDPNTQNEVPVPELINIDTMLNRIDDFNALFDIELDLDTIRLNLLAFDPGVITTTQIRSDPQNVHDSNVNNQLLEKYNRLCELNGTRTVTMDDIINEAKRLKNNEKIIQVLDTISANHIPISKLGDIEANIVCHVYQRAKTPDLKSAFFDALNDCHEKGNIVCSQGRVSRILSCLTKLDDDEILSGSLKTDDILKNEFMSKAHNILQTLLKNLNSDDKIRYDNNDPEIDERLRMDLSDRLRDEYSSIIDEQKLNNLIMQAIAGI